MSSSSPPVQLPTSTTDPHSKERRSKRRGRLHLFWDLLFAVLRLVGRHAKGFYATAGLLLLSGAILAVLGTWTFVEVASEVREGDTQTFDDYVMRLVAENQHPTIERAMLEITFLGTGLVVMVIVVIASLFLWLTRHRYSASLLVFATAGALILNNLLKAGFDRPRPQIFQWGTHVLSSSFPSGHAMSATVVYSMVAFLAARLEAKHFVRWIVMLAATLLIVLIGTSRVYLGVHFPTDILAGVLIGFAWAGFCMAMFEALYRMGRRAAPAEVAQQELPAPQVDPPLPKAEIDLSPREVDRAVDAAEDDQREVAIDSQSSRADQASRKPNESAGDESM